MYYDINSSNAKRARINCIGVFQNYYQTHQLKEYSPSTIGWVRLVESSARSTTADCSQISSLETFFMFFGGK